MNTRVVAMARSVGSAGDDVARAVAEQLGFRFYDYQVVQTAAQDAGVSPETVSEAEHTPSLFTRILEALARNPSMPVAAWADPVPLATSPLLTSAEYRRFIEDVIRDLADQGEAVLLGHGAVMSLSDRPRHDARSHHRIGRGACSADRREHERRRGDRAQDRRAHR